MSQRTDIQQLVDELFPFHVTVDRKGVIVRIGKSLKPLVGEAVGSDFFSHFSAVRPEVTDAPGLFGHLDRVALLQVRALRAHLRGQFIVVGEGHLTFVGSPRIADAASRQLWPLGVVDFAPHDGTADYAMALEAHHMQVQQLQELAEELKESERRERALRERAEAATRAKADFLANISHEIRTPLANLLGYAEVLSDEAIESSERANALKVIERNGQHLVALLGEVLEYSRLESGNITLNRTPTDVADLVGDVVLAAQTTARERQVDLVLKPAPAEASAPVLTDPVRVRQVVMNLISNAIKYSPRGRVEVSLGVTTWNGNNEFRIDVRDTGPGIPEALLATVFEPFSQLERGFSRTATDGVGLGLAISRRLAVALGGRLGATSRVGEGSCFTFTFGGAPAPGAITSPPALRDAPPATPASPLLGRRVLTVEDSEDCLRLEVNHLTHAGAEVSVAKTGIDGVEAVREALECKSPPDVILMDLHLPGIDGVEATRQIRGLGYTGRIIAVTAAAERFHLNRALEAGCNEYRTKPLPRAELIAVCRAP